MEQFVTKPVYVTAWKNREDVSIPYNGLIIPPGQYYIEEVVSGSKFILRECDVNENYVRVNSIENPYEDKEQFNKEIEDATELAELDQLFNDN